MSHCSSDTMSVLLYGFFISGMMDGGQMQQTLLSVSEQILHNIKQEYKRLQKRRHLDSIYQHVDSCSPLDLQSIQSGSTLPGNFSWLPLKRDAAEWLAASFFSLFFFCPSSGCHIFAFTALTRKDKEALKAHC